MRLSGKTFVESIVLVLGLQLAADRGYDKDVVQRMNVGYNARLAQKCLLNN